MSYDIDLSYSAKYYIIITIQSLFPFSNIVDKDLADYIILSNSYFLENS